MHALLEMLTAAFGGLTGAMLVMAPYLWRQRRSIKRGGR